jgi:hypothetical protein
MIKALIKLIEGDDYDLNEWDEASAKTPIVGDAKPPKIKALTEIIPAKKQQSKLRNVVGMFSPIVPPWLLELEYEEKNYILAKSQLEMIVADEDINDWTYLLERFNGLIGNLIKVLDNIRRVNYHKIVADKLFEQEIQTRKLKITEKLLEKVNERKDNKKSDDEKSNNLAVAATALIAAGGLGYAASRVYDPDMPPADADYTKIAGYLMRKYDLEDYQASAIVGVWMNEGMGKGRPDDIEDSYAAQYGDFGPPPIGSSRVGYGWAQWTNMAPGGRLDQVANAIGVTDRPWTNSDNLRAFDWELGKLFPGMMEELKDTSDVAEATEVFTTIYEAGGDLQPYFDMHGPDFLQRRLDSASSVYNGLQKEAAGAILIPQLLDTPIIYNDPTKSIGDLIIDRPTIVDVAEVGEPVVVIPTERPIGKEVLNILFKEPFRKIEEIFERKYSQETKARSPIQIQNNITSINRTSIPKSPDQKSSYNPDMKMDTPIDVKSAIISKYDPSLASGPISEVFSEAHSTIQSTIVPSIFSSPKQVSNIDTVAQRTENVFGPPIILLTQDIYATEE